MIDLRCGDARAVLAGMADASVDAVVTDPPYALTDKQGGSKGFMGARWDTGQVAHDPAFWAEVLRVAKPGAHLVAFGGTRTAHRLACAIEDAGWEIRDSLYLLWCHGQGFPKSLDVSKALDKRAGAERDWREVPRRGGPGGHSAHIDQISARRKSGIGWASGPATDAARQWDGWGTALKPSAEPIVLARKPLSEPTVAANVLAHGTGALHIDACRVPTGGEVIARDFAVQRDSGYGYCRPTPARQGTWTNTAGRWPPNTLFSHVGGPDGCQPAGVRRVPADKRGQGRPRGTFPHSDDAWGNGHRAYTGAETAGDGTEQQQEYLCHPQCPIRLLDEQAGPRTSGGYPPEGAQRTRVATYGQPNERGEQRFTSSTGSASRYFPTFGPDPQDAVPFRYVPKASRAERQAGCEDLPYERPGVLADDSYVRPADGKAGDTTRTIRGNTHCCVKPLGLMAWLCKLVTPEGGVVLDCFCGSGSTGVACVREGFGFIGIEQSAEYVEIARARIAHEQERRDGQLALPLGHAYG